MTFEEDDSIDSIKFSDRYVVKIFYGDIEKITEVDHSSISSIDEVFGSNTLQICNMAFDALENFSCFLHS